MKKKYAVYFVSLLLLFTCIPAFFAAEKGPIELEHTTVKGSVEPGEVAQYTLKISNRKEIAETFYLSLGDIRFSPTLIPITHFTSGIRVPAKSIVETDLFLVPHQGLRIGEYSVRVDLRSQSTGEVLSDILTIYVAPAPEAYIAPNVSVRLGVPENIDPREEFTVTVSASNNNKLNLGEVLVDVKSGLFHREQTMELGPHGSDSVSFKIQLDPLQQPREDFVIATVSKENMIFGLDQMDISVVQYSPPFQQQYKDTTNFLKTTTDITLTNKGNVHRKEEFKVEMYWYRRLFSESAFPHELVRQNSMPYWAFDVNLDPAESTTISVTTSYRYPFALLILLLISGVMYYLLRAPIVISKHAKVIAKTEGGISKLKIYLKIRNRSSSVFEDIRVVDKVSSIARILREQQVGTLAPSKVAHKGRFTYAEWKIPKLESGEERLIHYKIESRLSILGDFKLKRAMVEYTKGDVRSQSFSNEFFIDVEGRETVLPTMPEAEKPVLKE